MARSWHLGNWNMWNDLLKPMAIRKKIVMKSMKYEISGNICIWYILVLVQIMPAMPEGSATEVVPLRSKSRQVRQNEAFHWMLLLSSDGLLVLWGSWDLDIQVLETSLFHFYMYPGQGGNWPPRPLALIGQGVVVECLDGKLGDQWKFCLFFCSFLVH